jgi:hypothetical protein
MIHELRMVFESFFRSRSLSMFSAPRPSTSAMKCVRCLQLNTFPRPKDAIAVKDGQSVCEHHALV